MKADKQASPKGDAFFVLVMDEQGRLEITYSSRVRVTFMDRLLWIMLCVSGCNPNLRKILDKIATDSFRKLAFRSSHLDQ